MSPIRILLVQPDPREAAFIQDALDECGWLGDVTRVETLEDALALVGGGTIDAVLLDLDLPDSRKSWSFLPMQSIAPHVPIILLVDADQEALAARLVREGAEDYLIKSEIDCVPLRRSVSNAVERHRLLEAARSEGILDPPTGLLNTRGFLMQAELLRQSALQFHATVHLHIAESGVANPEERNLLLLGITDELRNASGPLHAIARIDKDRVAAIVVDQVPSLNGIELDPTEPVTMDLVESLTVRT